MLAIPLYGCCVYVGLLQPGGAAIEYAAATPNSAIAGKRLRRRDKRRAWASAPQSFACVDDPTRATVLVRDGDDPRASTLHFFGPRRQQGWPFVAVPLSFGLAGARGVVGVDSFESCGRGCAYFYLGYTVF